MTEQECRSDRADTARNRRKSGRDLRHRGVDVARETPVGRRVRAHVDDRGAGGDVTGADQPGPAGRRDQDVGLPGDRREVRGTRVADRHGGVAVEQQVGGWLPDYDRTAYHDRVPAAQLHTVVVKEHQHRLRRRRGERGQSGDQAADRLRARTVHVFGRRDGGRQPGEARARRERRLQDDAVHFRVVGELREGSADTRDGGRAGHVAGDPLPGGRVGDRPDVGRAAAVVVRRDHGQPWLAPVGRQPGRPFGHDGAKLAGELPAAQLRQPCSVVNARSPRGWH